MWGAKYSLLPGWHQIVPCVATRESVSLGMVTSRRDGERAPLNYFSPVVHERLLRVVASAARMNLGRCRQRARSSGR